MNHSNQIRIGTVLAAVVLQSIFQMGCACMRDGGAASTIELFNGKNLKGWKSVLADPSVKPEAVWSVRDGMIVCLGAPIGFLHSEQEFTNFRLVVEYRWAPGSKPGNSGIFSRIHQQFTALPRCCECQLMNGSAGDIMTLQGMTMTAQQPRYFSVAKHPQAGDIAGVKKTADQEKPAGEWNRVEILAQGAQYKVWMNGILVNEVEGIQVVRGPVGLQSEGGEIHFRRASLTPMP
jgi:hypothetical protein